jgi:DNA-binding transcriptional MocR family regulator
MRTISGLQVGRLLGGWRGGPGSAYRGLADAIEMLIQDGRLPLEARLPAERELAGTLKVSRTTVSAAYQRLRTDGYLVSRRGSGSVVTRPDGEPGRALGWVPVPSRAGVLDLAIAALPADQPVLDNAVGQAVTHLPEHAATHGYDPAGLPVLRVAIARRYTERGVPTSPAEILVTSGAQHGFDLLLRLLTKPGDRVLIESPTYPNALAAVTENDCRPVPVSMDGEWDIESFADTMRQSAPILGYLIPEFHNPTGALMPAETRAALATVARRTGTYLVADESFTDLSLDGSAPPLSMASYDRGDRVIGLGSLSKSHWAGVRIGWIRASQTLIRRLADGRAVIDMSPPVLEQLIGERLLAAGPEPIAFRQQMLAGRRDALVAALAETFPQWSFTVPDGGMALWIRLDAPVSSALAASARRHNVVVAPGPRFGLAAVMERRLRIPFTLAEPELVESVRRLAIAHHEAYKDTGTDTSCNVA